METCETCVYSARAEDKYPCNECTGLNSHYSFDHDSASQLVKSVESDPSGMPLSAPGAKADLNKPRVDLIFDAMPLALMEVARVATFGAAKYSEHGWLKVPNGIQRYTAAMDRHRLQEGEWIDSDSGIAHAAHLAWNSLARLELLLREGARK